MCYLWNSFLGADGGSLVVDKRMAAKDWKQYYRVFPFIRARAGDVAESRVADVTSVSVRPGKSFGHLRQSTSSKGGGKSGFDKLDEIFRKYEVRIVGETYTARIA
jgi:hypothetical protein